MIVCRTSIRRFDGDAAPTLHAAVFGRGAVGLRFVAWTTIDKGTNRCAAANDAPSVELAWVPHEQVKDETSSPAEIDAALGDPDHIPLLLVPDKERPCAWMSDDGSPFPVVEIKGIPMVLALRVEDIQAGTYGQFTFGWQSQRRKS